MALGYLFILFILIVLISVIGIISLHYSRKEKTKNIMFYILNLWLVLINYITVTGLPSNYLIQRTIGIILGTLSIVSIFIKNTNKTKLSYQIITIAIITSVVYLIFF